MKERESSQSTFGVGIGASCPGLLPGLVSVGEPRGGPGRGAAVPSTGPSQGLDPALTSRLLVPSLARKPQRAKWGFWERPGLAPSPWSLHLWLPRQ